MISSNGTFIGADLNGVKQAIPAGYLDTTEAGDGLITQYFAFDANSQLLARRDDNGNVTQYIFDNQERTKVERKALNFTGTTFTVAGGDSGTFTPFLAGTAPVSTRPGFTDITFTFDRDSNLVNRVDEAGNVIVSTFDGLSRRTALNITPAVGFIGTTQQIWSYDGLSRQTSSFDNNEPADPNDDVSTDTFFDSLSRLLEEQQQIGLLSAKAVSYQFDIAASNSVFQPSALVYPDGRQVNNAYDNLDRLVSRTDNGQSSPIGTNTYIGTWRVATLTFQNQTRLSYFAGITDVGYDALRRVVNHRWEKFTPTTPLGSGSLLVGFGYTYDRANNRLSQEKLHDLNNSELYKYRSDYELTSFARGTLNATKTGIVAATTTAGALQNQTWNLDGTGNWSANTHTTGGVTGTENRTSSNVNEIATLSGSPYGRNVNFTFQFDNNGNLLNDGVRSYQWDALGRLQAVSRNSDGLLIGDYSYGADNRRFRKVVTNGGVDGTANNGTTDFYWSAWQTIEERDGLDLVTQQYVYGIGLNELWTLDDRRLGILVAQLNDGLLDERKFYQTDELSSVYTLTNETGQILVGYQYDAYGVPTEFGQGLGGAVTFGSNVVVVGTTVPTNPYGYTGYYRDAESFLNYARRRYYSADQARFLSRDSLGYFAGDVNLYRYVANNPTGLVDPLGTIAILPIFAAAALVVSPVGLAVGAGILVTVVGVAVYRSYAAEAARKAAEAEAAKKTATKVAEEVYPPPPPPQRPPPPPPLEKKKETCATKYPNYALCSALDSSDTGFRYPGVDAVIAALQALDRFSLDVFERIEKKHAKMGKDESNYPCSPPKAGGTHYNLYGWRYGACQGSFIVSVVCCECCRDTPNGPPVKEGPRCDIPRKRSGNIPELN